VDLALLDTLAYEAAEEKPIVEGSLLPVVAAALVGVGVGRVSDAALSRSVFFYYGVDAVVFFVPFLLFHNHRYHRYHHPTTRDHRRLKKNGHCSCHDHDHDQYHDHGRLCPCLHHNYYFQFQRLCY
jgi:ABC-type nickel/cobalt efflux system permease component RcnA